MAHLSLLTHGKMILLAEILDVSEPTAVGHLEFFWGGVYQDRSVCADGRLTNWATRRIAATARWKGDPDLFVDAMKEVGFLDDENGTISVHDYGDWVPDFIKKRIARANNADSGGQRWTTVDNGGQRRRCPPETKRNETKRKKNSLPPNGGREGDFPSTTSKSKTAPLLDAVCAEWFGGSAKGTDARRAKRITKALEQRGAHPEQVASTAAAFREKWPDAECTPEGVEKHWVALTKLAARNPLMPAPLPREVKR